MEGLSRMVGRLSQGFEDFAGFEERAWPAVSNQKGYRSPSRGDMMRIVKNYRAVANNVHLDLEAIEFLVDG